MATEPIWRLGAILNESLATTLRFAAWHLELGADRLFLLFDNPQDPAIGVLRDHPKITCIPCTPDFWAELGLTQGTRFTKRQNAALTWVYRQVPDGWFLNVDADEFLFPGPKGLAPLLADVAETDSAVRILTAEAVAWLGQGGTVTRFRLPMERRPIRRAVYGADAGLFGPRRLGLVGHPQGKSLTRAGLADVRLRQHWPQNAAGERLPEKVIDAGTGAYLLHFIGLDFAAWHGKVDWRLRSRGFSGPLSEKVSEALLCEDAEDRLLDLHRRLHHVSPDVWARMESAGVALSLSIDLDAPVLRQFSLDLADG